MTRFAATMFHTAAHQQAHPVCKCCWTLLMQVLVLSWIVFVPCTRTDLTFHSYFVHIILLSCCSLKCNFPETKILNSLEISWHKTS